MPTVEDFLSASAFCRERLNPYLFAYALSVAMLHRNDTQAAPLPQFAGRFPEKYFDGGVFSEVRREANLVSADDREPLVIPRDFTGTDLEPEHRVAYFREDIGVNLCHFHWHLVYPFSNAMGVVRKDRRGELFYYFHQQIIARYNLERFSNRLGRVKRFLDFREPMEDGYFPKLSTLLASRNWPPRQAGTRLKEDENGTIVPIINEQGIDLLGNVIEASDLSINRNLYGDMHNLGHLAIAYSHDPDHRHLGKPGDLFSVMRILKKEYGKRKGNCLFITCSSDSGTWNNLLGSVQNYAVERHGSKLCERENKLRKLLRNKNHRISRYCVKSRVKNQELDCVGGIEGSAH
ncbi:Phenoloxidase 1 [Gryllus bimaculatus]|nr:Phenoloxidase 1 [Gryllus bimaculatus]